MVCSLRFGSGFILVLQARRCHCIRLLLVVLLRSFSFASTWLLSGQSVNRELLGRAQVWRPMLSVCKALLTHDMDWESNVTRADLSITARAERDAMGYVSSADFNGFCN